MNFLSITFYVFCPIFVGVYFRIPKRYRYLVLLAGSYIFYGYGSPQQLVFLFCSTIITYVGGIAIERRRGRSVLFVAFILNISLLLVFKYSNFLIQNVNLLSEKFLNGTIHLNELTLILPIGLSFFVFQSCTYLTDIYRGNIKAEKNILLYASFVAFFPTVLSGPIQKSRELLPKIKNPDNFDSTEAKKGTVLFIWGLFEKLVVANHLSFIANSVYSEIGSHSGIYYILAAISFSVYIYADFSAYSDMARGISKILGIQIGKNFDNPYLSTSTSEFWRRWHISLNSWLIENIYIPLGGNRKGKLRKYFNIMIVFLISGFWHGASWHFVIWGAMNGLIAIIGQMMMPLKSRIYERIKVNPDLESVKFLRRAFVFVLISFTWIFFENGVQDSLNIFRNIISFRLINVFDPELLNIAGTAASTFLTLIATGVFCGVQWKRQNEALCFERFDRQPLLFQSMLMAIIIVVCVFASCTSGTNVNSQFLYFQF